MPQRVWTKYINVDGKNIAVCQHRESNRVVLVKTGTTPKRNKIKNQPQFLSFWETGVWWKTEV